VKNPGERRYAGHTWAFYLRELPRFPVFCRESIKSNAFTISACHPRETAPPHDAVIAIDVLVLVPE